MMNRNKFKKIAAIACSAVLSGALAFSLTACNNNDNDKSTDDGTKTTQDALLLNKSTATVKVGEAVTLNVTSSTTGTITWSTSEPSVATATADASNSKLCTVTGVKAGTATITAKDGDLTATCTITVEAAQQGDDNKTLTPVNVVSGGENEASFVSGWRYWTGDGTATVNSCVTYKEKNDLNIKYNFTSGLFYSIQLFYKDKTAGTDHDIALTVVSDVATYITLNGQKTELSVGENEVKVEHYTGATLSVQFGVEGENIVSGVHEFTFKDIVVKSNATVELEAPDYSYDANTKVITINDEAGNAANVEKYVLGVFKNATDEAPAYTIDVTSGSAVNFGTVATGEYVLKLRAENSSTTVINSGWSEKTVNLNWSNAKTPLTYSEQSKIAEASNTWYFWNQDWDHVCKVTECYIQDNTINVVGLTNNVGASWSFQLFYKGTAGKKFNITVTADAAGSMTVNGTVKELTANTAVTFENVDASNLAIIFGDNPSGSTDKNLNGNITLVIAEV